MVILNLGCGDKVSNNTDIVNIDFSPKLRIKNKPIINIISKLIIDKTRYEKIQNLPDNVLAHDLRKGIPFADRSVDAVYHGHMLEHADRDTAPRFLRENRRVTKAGGTIRIVVPDLECLARSYIAHIETCVRNEESVPSHDRYVADILEQCVRKESYGSSQQSAIRRRLENLILGDARKGGETHQWMYDRFNLKHALEEAGFREVRVVDFSTSAITDWESYGLDRNSDRSEYKPGSLYMEATR